MLQSTLKLLDPSVLRYADLFAAILVDQEQESLIPELFEVFGRESLLKFLDIFAGSTIEVPSREVLRNIVRDVNIYVSLRDKVATADELAQKYEISDREVRRIRDKVAETARILGE